MKKQILVLSCLILSASYVLFNGCSKDDTTAPVITLNGDASVSSSLNATYTDMGATATDEKDGSVTVTTDNPVNKDLAGTYTVTYTASDAAGNIATATRTVVVKNDAAYLDGTYVCSEDNFVTTWTQTVTADATHNNRIIFQYFGYYVTHPLSPKIYGQVIGSSVELSTSQTAVGGNSGCTHTIAPNGTGTIPIALVSGKYNFSIKFFDTEVAGGTACPGTGAVPTEDVCHQQ